MTNIYGNQDLFTYILRQRHFAIVPKRRNILSKYLPSKSLGIRFTAIPRFHPTPAGFSLVIPQRRQMMPFREMAHTSAPTDTDRKPQCCSVCGGTFAALGRNCQWEPSGKVFEISFRTAKRCWLSSAQIPARPTLIALKVTPAGASTCCQASPQGFCLLMPYRKNTMPFRATVHT